MPVPQYTPEQRAAVIVEWKAGASLSQLSKGYSVSKTTVARWVKGVARTTGPAQVQVPKTTRALTPPRLPERTLDEMAWELVEASFGATTAINRLAATPAWAEKQNAHDLGILYGIIADKLIRVLSSQSGPGSGPTADPEEHAGGVAAG